MYREQRYTILILPHGHKDYFMQIILRSSDLRRLRSSCPAVMGKQYHKGHSIYKSLPLSILGTER